MKKILFFAALLALAGCAEMFRTSSSVANRVYVGMPVAEFLGHAGRDAKIEAMEPGLTVYRIDDYNLYDGHSFLTGVKLFYFDGEQKLFKMDSQDFRSDFDRIVAIGEMEKKRGAMPQPDPKGVK